jgi:hypothetical protein
VDINRNATQTGKLLYLLKMRPAITLLDGDAYTGVDAYSISDREN